jgi:hypothetical protein
MPMEPCRPHARTPRIAALLGAALMVLATAADAGKIGSRYDRDADFSNLESYAWRPGEKKPEGSPLAPGGEIDTMIRGAVDAELARRGFRPAADGEEPDFVIGYDAARETAVDNPNLRRDVTSGVAWVVEGEYRSWERGTLILTVHRPGEDRAIWSAWTTEDLKHPDGPSQRQVERATRKLLKRFPPR